MVNFRVGVTGNGVALRLHLPVVSSISYITPVRVRLPRVNGTGNLADAFTSHLDTPDRIDLLIVGTPPFAHECHVRAAIDSGIPVLCEKPCGLSAEQAERMEAHRSRLGVPVGVNYQLRFDQDVLSFRSKLQSLDPRLLHIVYSSGARIDMRGAPSWYRDANWGGGVRFSVLCHLVDLVHFLGYSFRSVAAEVSHLDAGQTRHSSDLPLDNIEVSAMLTKVVQARISAITTSSQSRFVVAARNGDDFVSLDLITGRITCGEGEIDDRTIHAPDSLASTSPRPWRSSFETLLYHVTSTGTKQSLDMSGCATLQDAIRVHKVIEAMARSWSSGHEVTVVDATG